MFQRLQTAIKAIAMGENTPDTSSLLPIFENGVADTTHPSIQSFIKVREELMTKERSQRSDAEFRSSLSSTARKASSIIAKIRTQELESTWSTNSSSSLNEELFPGMMFNIAKPALETTKLWKIVQKMPKGTLLHCHLGAMVDLEWVFSEAVEMEGMCIISDTPLVDDSIRDTAALKFLYSNASDLESQPSVWSPDYIPGSYIPIKTAANIFPKGGTQGFISWMKDRCSITQYESLQQHLGVDDVWKKLNSAFSILPGVVYYEPMLRSYLRKFFTTLLEDGVRWVEFRCSPFLPIYPTKKMEPYKDAGELLRILEEEIEDFKDKNPGFWGARMIWSSIRIWGTEKVLEDMNLCLRLKHLYPNLISGYDLVGHEDAGRTLASLTPELLYFKSQCVSQSLNIPLFLHAGECVGTGTTTDQNLYTAILLGSRRLGHGFSLYKHPLLIDEVKERNVLVESCPISNEVLRYTASIMSHPLPALISRGVKASLSNDDPAMLGQGTSGLSYDFWQAVQGWEDLGVEGLGALAENSIRWAAFTDESDEEWQKGIEEGEKGEGIRGQRMREWKNEWTAFCQWVIDEFSN